MRSYQHFLNRHRRHLLKYYYLYFQQNYQHYFLVMGLLMVCFPRHLSLQLQHHHLDLLNHRHRFHLPHPYSLARLPNRRILHFES
jgi:hypothetical protein